MFKPAARERRQNSTDVVKRRKTPRVENVRIYIWYVNRIEFREQKRRFRLDYTLPTADIVKNDHFTASRRTKRHFSIRFCVYS